MPASSASAFVINQKTFILSSMSEVSRHPRPSQGIAEGFFAYLADAEIYTEAATVANHIAERTLYRVEVLQVDEATPQDRIRIRIGGGWLQDERPSVRLLLRAVQGVRAYNSGPPIDSSLTTFATELD